jgi:hypothetical protein
MSAVADPAAAAVLLAATGLTAEPRADSPTAERVAG